MPTITERRGTLDANRKKLKAIFDVMGPDLDAQKALEAKSVDGAKSTQDVVAEMQRLNRAIDDDATHIELDRGRETLKALDETWDALGAPIQFPGAGGREQSKYAGKTLGHLFTESNAFKQYNKTARRSPEVEIVIDDENEFKRLLGVKAVLTETGYPIQAVRTGLILPGALRRPVVADVIPDGTTRTTAIVYMEETTTTNAAAAVAEGAAKPESTLVFTEKTSSVRKIATVLPITDELMNDEPAMRSYVEARLRLFLQLAEENQLLVGTGTPPQILGLYNISGINTQAKGADPTPDAVYKGMDLIRTLAFLEPDAVIAHPTDWQDVRLLRTADGLYIWGNPSETAPQRIWGVPVIVTPAATLNTMLVLAAQQGMQIFRRSEVSFAVSDQHQDFFVLNQLMLRVEERLALVVYRPKAICTITGV
jgi:HK97 family phage major capsid protein